MPIPTDYVSVNLRKSFLYEDHPEAEVKIDSCSAADLGIPPEFHDTEKFRPFFVRATILIPGRKAVVGFKEVPWKTRTKDGKTIDLVLDPEVFRKLGTNALGRALKDAGYPDKLPEFTALVTWRKRNIELEAMRHGPVAAIEAGDEMRAALTKAAVADPVDEHPDDDGDDATEVEAEVVENPPADLKPGGVVTPQPDPGLKHAEATEHALRTEKFADRAIVGGPPPGVDAETGEVGAITCPYTEDDLKDAWSLLADESQEALRKNLMGRGLWRALTKASDRKLVLAMLKSGRVRQDAAPAAPVAADPPPTAPTQPEAPVAGYEDAVAGLWSLVDDLAKTDETVTEFVEHWLGENGLTRETAKGEDVEALLDALEAAEPTDSDEEPF